MQTVIVSEKKQDKFERAFSKAYADLSRKFTKIEWQFSSGTGTSIAGSGSQLYTAVLIGIS